MVVRRHERILLQLLVGDRDLLLVAEELEVLQGQLLHLVGGVAALEVVAEAVALDGVGEDDGRLALGVQGALVGGVDLAVVVAAAAQVPQLLVGHVLDELLGALVAAEEVLADVGAVVGLEGLVVAVLGGVHDVDECAVLILFQQLVPLAAPHDLDHVPAGADEEALQLLDDLAVAAHWAVETLQVAVDHEGEVVQAVQGGHLDQAAGFRLVHLAVAEECPDVLLVGVLDAAVLQVLVKACLVDRVHRAQAHGHGGELPEVRHAVRVRVGRQAALLAGVLLAEAVHVVFAQAAFHEGAGVHAGGGVALEEDLVAALWCVLAFEEVVEADLVQRRCGGVGGDVAADLDAGALRAVHHHCGVPAHPAAVALLNLLVAREFRLELGGDGVDQVGRGQRRQRHALGVGALDQAQHEVAGALRIGFLQQTVEGVHPFLGFLRVRVVQVGRYAFAQRENVGVNFGRVLHASVFHLGLFLGHFNLLASVGQYVPEFTCSCARFLTAGDLW